MDVLAFAKSCTKLASYLKSANMERKTMLSYITLIMNYIHRLASDEQFHVTAGESMNHFVGLVKKLRDRQDEAIDPVMLKELTGAVQKMASAVKSTVKALTTEKSETPNVPEQVASVASTTLQHQIALLPQSSHTEYSQDEIDISSYVNSYLNDDSKILAPKEDSHSMPQMDKSSNEQPHQRVGPMGYRHEFNEMSTTMTVGTPISIALPSPASRKPQNSPTATSNESITEETNERNSLDRGTKSLKSPSQSKLRESGTSIASSLRSVDAHEQSMRPLGLKWKSTKDWSSYILVLELSGLQSDTLIFGNDHRVVHALPSDIWTLCKQLQTVSPSLPKLLEFDYKNKLSDALVDRHFQEFKTFFDAINQQPIFLNHSATKSFLQDCCQSKSD
jgi:hypothetical protein